MTTLKEFAQWWLDAGRPHNLPDSASVVETDHSLSFPVFRRDAYQIELYMGKPNFTSSKHSHPFDQLIIFQGGKMFARRGQDLEENPPWQGHDHADVDLISEILPRGQWHQIKSLDRGFVFYNVQYWYDLEPTSAVIEYSGESMGPIHNQIIRNASK